MFPFFGSKNNETESTEPREYAWDFETGDFALKNGAPYIVEGFEALRIWIYKALKTERYEYLAHSWDYGAELKTLLGTKMQKSEADVVFKNVMLDALMINPNINGVSNVNADFVAGEWKIEAVITTPYGEVTINV